MRAVLQRVSKAEVRSEGRETAAVGRGLVVLLGVARGDTAADADLLAGKAAGLRVFTDADGRLNLSVREVQGEVLAVSNFTVLGDARKGRRPSFAEAAPGPAAEPLFDRFVETLRAAGVPVATGFFGAHMEVDLCNDGPVTVVLDTALSGTAAGH